MEPLTQKQKKAFEVLKEQFGYVNALQVPKITKIVVSAGTGRGMKSDKNRNQLVVDRLSKITGQKGSIRGAKKSIATFKIRTGDPVGVMVTLRGERMRSFFDKLVHIALPRTKDFRGVNRSSVDGTGNMTLGIREHTIFPETPDEEIKDVFGLAITVGTTAKNRSEAMAYFEYLGVPFKKEEEKKKRAVRKKK
jgi:large subunit ribosomal protein L5